MAGARIGNKSRQGLMQALLLAVPVSLLAAFILVQWLKPLHLPIVVKVIGTSVLVMCTEIFCILLLYRR